MSDIKSTLTVKPWVKEYLIPIGSLLIAALALPAQYEQIPTWLIWIGTTYLVVVAIVVLYAPLSRVMSYLLNEWRLRRLTTACFPEVLESVRKFRQLVADRNINTLLYVLNLAATYDQQKGKSLPPEPEYIETVRDLLSSIEGRAKRCKSGDFSPLCKELSSLINSYNRFCSQRLRRLEEFISGSGLEEHRLRHLRQQWNVQRESHMAFIRDWESLAKRINEKTRNKLCFEYYEPLGTLE